MSTILWTNRGSTVADLDRFQQYFGANAQNARATVDAALSAWQGVVDNFNYTNVGQPGYAPVANRYTVTITAGVLGSGTLGVTNFNSIDLVGRPFRATIDMDNDAAGNAWYFDPRPLDHAEFPSILNRFAATNGPSGTDFYSVVLHELGHAMGFALASPAPLRLLNRISNPGLPPPNHVIRLFNFLDGSRATLTTEGGGHTVPNVIAGLPAHPDDLLNATIGPRTRRLISDLNARMLGDGFGYTINLPSSQQTFLATLNTAAGALLLNGEPPNTNDLILVYRLGSDLGVYINGATASFPAASVTSIIMNAGNGDDIILLLDPFSGVSVTINGNFGSDILLGPDSVNTWRVTSLDAGFLNSHITFTTLETLIGGAEADTFLFNNGQRVNGSIFGQGGVNKLDYSAYTTGVVANLQTYTATGVGGVIFGVQDITGGAGNDLLVGDDQSNVLEGGAGRDVLIGGGSGYTLQPDTLRGGAGENLLIGGWTFYDVDPTSLTAILNEWTRPDLLYADRAANLQSGAGGVPVLDATTVYSNYGGNTLQGGADLDLFFGNVALDTLNRDPATEILVEIA